MPRPEVRAYLDHASVSPLRPEVIAALAQLLEVAQADPGRPYAEALVIRDLIEDARRSVASLAGATPRQIVFTSSIAESATTSVAGLALGGRVLAARTERTSVLEASARHGSLDVVDVSPSGHLNLEILEAGLQTHEATLACCQIANHETGVLNDVEAVIELARRHGAAVHVDASIALGHLPVDLGALDADAITVAGELIGGPVGSAAIIVRKGRVLPPLIVGGSQERARRAGLESLLGIVGFGIAAEVLRPAGVVEAEQTRAIAHMGRIEAAMTAVDGVSAIGESDLVGRAGHLRSFTVEGVEAEPVLLGLDRAGISVHSGSACASESLEPSPVLDAMGIDAAQSLRVSVGWSTTDADVERLSAKFAGVVESLRALRS